MGGAFDFWAQAQPQVLAIGAAIFAAISATLWFLQSGETLHEFWDRVRQRRHIKSITRHTDPDLITVARMLENVFEGDSREDSGSLRDLVRNASSDWRPVQQRQSVLFVLALKDKGKILGVCLAQYFVQKRTIFLWYVAVDPAHKHNDQLIQATGLDLIAALLPRCDRIAPFADVITEVDLTGDNEREARKRLWLFQNWAEELSTRAGRKVPVKVYRLPLRYRQPVLDPVDIPRDPQMALDRWLLYAPREPADGVLEGNPATLSKAGATRLLDTLLIDSYASAYLESPAYQQHCRARLDEITGSLPETLLLISDWRAQ